MTFEESLSQIGRDLAWLIADPIPVHDADVEPALAGRESIHQLLDTLAADGALGRRMGGTKVAELVQDPSAVMNNLRRKTARIPAQDPHALLAADGTTPTSRLWLSIHRHAVVARHEWAHADPSSRPREADLWPLMADGAALTGAVAVLDRRLVPALQRAGRDEDARLIGAGGLSGLRLAAERVGALARTGPLPNPAPLRRPGPRSPVAVRSVLAQREGYRRLNELLTSSTGAHPKQMQALLALHAGTIGRAATLVGDRPDLAAAMLEHARHIARATQAMKRIESIQDLDPRPVVQARQLDKFVTAELDAARRSDVGMVVARAMPATWRTLIEYADRHVAAGRWLVGTDDPDRGPLWVRADLLDRRPDALDALHQARESADLAAARVGPDPLPAQAPAVHVRPAREALAGLLASTDVTERPRTPLHRVTPPDLGR